ncbi:hypothetical protein B0T16DRAFT_454292 [Cercophora newfieldiana]|uniref:Uncharacterized protein n=1 Tax=Cercophora newfieldiana TaxID=92897 RepID=A0AA40CUH2_9PEZI|nr:hypothetical protein B0T16DRAFT_454292 [Cercophora newfieldiana]
MAAQTSFAISYPVAYGRSGYNKDGSDDEEEDKNRVYGRSGYNKDGDDEEDKEKK